MSKSNTTYKHHLHQGWLLAACAAPGVLGAAWGLLTVLLITSDSSDPSDPLMYTLFLVLSTITVCFWASTVHKHHRKNKGHSPGVQRSTVTGSPDA